LRRAILDRRASLVTDREGAALQVKEQALSLIVRLGDTLKSADIAGYIPVNSEIDPLPLMGALQELGFELALPATVGSKAPLTFRRWKLGDPLSPGEFGILEPQAAAGLVDVRLMLVPLVAFDDKGRRLGYGQGYYDRTLRALRSSAAVIAVGLGFDEQEVGEIPEDPFDERLDYIATPSRLMICGV
jgi:5-formyltetrahydrofolate cyclo-ligase